MNYAEVKLAAIEYARMNCKPVAIYFDGIEYRYIDSCKAFGLRVIEFISQYN